MRASLATKYLALSALLVLGAIACDRPQPTPDSAEGVDDEGQTGTTVSADDDEAAEEEGLVASGGVVQLKIEEVIQGAERLRIIGPRNEDGSLYDGEMQWLEAPPAQANLVGNLVRFQILRHLADEYDLPITPGDERAMVAERDSLKQFLPLFDDDASSPEVVADLTAQLAAVGLTVDDIRQLARDMILEEKISDHLAENFSDEMLWAIFQSSRDIADVLVVQMANSPTSQEVDRAVEQKDAEIRAEYRDNRDKYVIPEAVIATILEVPAGTKPAEAQEVLQKAQARLSAGEEPASIAEDLELILREKTAITAAMDRGAFGAEIHEIGLNMRSPRRAYIWRVEGRRAAQRRTLDRPLRREIGAALLRAEGITPSNQARAARAREILASVDVDGALSQAQRESLLRRLADADERWRAHHTGPFSLSEMGLIPGLGLSEELNAALQDLTLEHPISDILIDRERVLVARLIDRRYPEREQFEEERQAFRAEFLSQNRQRLVDQAVQTYRREHDVQINLRAVAERYGAKRSKEER